MFVNAIADAILGIADDSTDIPDSEHDHGGLITELLTYNVDPFAIKEVRTFQELVSAAFVVIAILLLCAAFLTARLPMQQLDEMIGVGFTENRIIDALIVIIFIPFLAYYGIYYILEINNAVSLMISDYMVMTFPFSSDNFIIYLSMSITFLLLTFVFLIRMVLIVVYTALAILLMLGFVLIEYRETALSYFYSFMKIVFLQPYLLIITVLGLIVIQNLPPSLGILEGAGYVALMLLLLKEGYGAISRDLVQNVIKIFVFRKVLKP